MKKIEKIILACLSFIFFLSCGEAGQPAARKGVLDLSGVNLLSSEPIALNGEWEFYWKKFIMSDDSYNVVLKPETIISIPSSWTSLKLDGENLPVKGYASYRLVVKTAARPHPLSLKIYEVYSDYSLWIDGQMLFTSGSVSADSYSEKNFRGNKIVDFYPAGDQFEIVIHVSNYTYFRSGILNGLYLGNTGEIHRSNAISIAFDVLFTGMMLIMSFYHFIFYYYRRHDPVILYTAFLYLLFSIRVLISDEIFLVTLFPGLDASSQIKFELFTVYLFLPVILNLYDSFSQGLLNRSVKKASLYVALLLSAIVVLSPKVVYMETLYVFGALAIAGLFYVISSVPSLLKKRVSGTWSFSVSVLIIILAGLHDLFIHYGFISSIPVTKYSSFIFLLSQSIFTSRQISLDYGSVESKKADLEKFQKKLKERVNERTKELSLAKENLQNEMQERKKIEDRLNTVKVIETVGILAGGIAHDFNNLLTSIIGNLSLIRRDTPEDSKTAVLLKDIEKASVRAKNLTSQLLTFSRGGAPNKKAASIKQLLEDTLDFVLSGSKVKCSLVIKDNLWNAVIDEGQISQVVHNLMLNARQSMPEGGEIEVKAENCVIDRERGLPLRAGKYILVIISDSGSGIDGGIIEKIFDPYFTTKDDGSGLGLSISYSIVNRHKGHISVVSEKGRGTVFSIYLPATESALPQIFDGSTVFSKPVKARVLVMDDEDYIRRLAVNMLSKLDCTVETAADGDEAVRAYSEALNAGYSFDLVIADLTVPGGKGGIDTISEIRKIDPGVRAIVSSGYSHDPVMANYDKYGFKGILVKPYTFDELKNAVLSVLQARSSDLEQ